MAFETFLEWLIPESLVNWAFPKPKESEPRITLNDAWLEWAKGIDYAVLKDLNSQRKHFINCVTMLNKLSLESVVESVQNLPKPETIHSYNNIKLENLSMQLGNKYFPFDKIPYTSNGVWYY